MILEENPADPKSPAGLSLFILFKEKVKFMRKIGFAKYLIGYTISDDDTREKFKEMLGEKFQDQSEWINESMFKLDGGDLQDVVGKLEEIFDEVKRISFGHDDFIKLYYAARLEDYTNLPERDLVKEVNISAPA